ncbi:MAG: DinB family protein [Bacteroidetes bacterium]|nr:DinB family protein [Bacteroidota bacterium]
MLFNHLLIAGKLEENAKIFSVLLSNKTSEEFLWRPAQGKWNLLEIVSHLFDEECDDFRARTKHTLSTPELPLPKTDPQGWVKERNYAANDYAITLKKFLSERKNSVQWLRDLKNPDWGKTHHHPKIGPITAKLFLVNWHAHDLLHMRQIIRTQFELLKQTGGEKLDYAGDW